MGNNAKKLMGAKQGKVAIKKSVNRGGKTFQQTYYVSPQEAMAMQRKAKKDVEKKKKPAAKPDDNMSKFIGTAGHVFAQQRREVLYEYWQKPLDKEGKKVLPVPPSPEKHVEIARAALAKHKASLETKIDALETLAPRGAAITGRVKKVYSAVGKVQRKPKYGTADKLQDLTGTRMVMDTSPEVMLTVAKIREKYEILEEDDYLTPPDPKEVAAAQALKDKLGERISKDKLDDAFSKKHPKEAYLLKRNGVMGGGYRSFHMIARDENGLTFELQVRTRGQNTHAEWAHDVYKPQDDEQRKYAKQHMKELNAYGSAIGEFFTKRETNPNTPEPPCPSVIARSPFNCIEV